MPTMKSSSVEIEIGGKIACLVVVPCSSRSQYVINDPYVSKRHVRLYTVVYENDEPDEIQTLVYAEDLSHNGAYWNGSLIGKGNGGYLLSDGDVLRLSRQTFLAFEHKTDRTPQVHFDFTQEKEMAVWSGFILLDALLIAAAFSQ